MIRADAFKQNLEKVQFKIVEAARAARRDPAEITLVVVTKGHPVDVVRDIIEAGAGILGESYAEEGAAKREMLDKQMGNVSDVKWHMIGHIQSRKAGLVADHFDFVHSLDSLKLARRLDRLAAVKGKKLPVLLQVNVSGEESKYGWATTKEKDILTLEADIEQIFALPNLKISGLMSIPPIADQPEDARPYFARTRHLRDRFAERFPSQNWKHLSMGMSNDFEAAILEGATLVRVGSAIVGPRPTT
ncbi:MAG: YggS family pyridoxal phosphate-dependent enzyme [Chloroflexi bacterium]|nr:YggS family pyridoxal phosphate-dependent enzyme [Chloroflexota bacterium]